MQTDDLLEAREEKYGKAWLECGEFLEGNNYVLYSNLFQKSPYSHNWMLILSKLYRALQSPYEPDHWKDIIGYATLVLRHIENKN